MMKNKHQRRKNHRKKQVNNHGKIIFSILFLNTFSSGKTEDHTESTAIQSSKQSFPHGKLADHSLPQGAILRRQVSIRSLIII